MALRAPSPSDAVIEFRGVTQQFGARVAVDRLFLSVPTGQVLGLLGPNGAGKTTVIKLAAGLIRPTAGSVLWCGAVLPFPFPGSTRRRLGLLSQETALYDELTVDENLRFAADLFGVAAPKQRVAAVLDVVGLASRRDDRVRTLSGGMQRRVAIARALVHDPELLILDEPTLGVDVDTRHAIWGHVRRLRGEGKTVLLSTNYLDEAEALCDHVVVLRDGRQVADGTPATLLRQTGRCVEIDCRVDDIDVVKQRMECLVGVSRLDVHETGLTAHLSVDTAADTVAAAAFDTGIVHAVRVRAPDMVEVIDSLSGRTDG